MAIDYTYAGTWTGKQIFNTASVQMGTLSVSTALVSDASKNVISSSTTATELGYVHGVTSAIQAQLDGKQASGSYALQSTTVNGHALSSNVVVSASDITTGTLPTAQLVANQIIRTIVLNILGGGAVPATGAQQSVTVPYAGTITNWYLVADQSGSCVVDVKRSGSSIVGTGNKPTLSGASSGNAAVSGWTSAAVAAGDIIQFNLDSATTVTGINLVLKVNAT